MTSRDVASSAFKDPDLPCVTFHCSRSTALVRTIRASSSFPLHASAAASAALLDGNSTYAPATSSGSSHNLAGWATFAKLYGMCMGKYPTGSNCNYHIQREVGRKIGMVGYSA